MAVDRGGLDNPKAFQNTYLVPLPKDPALIDMALLDNRHDTIASMTHRYRPDDELIAVKGTSNVTPHRYIHRSSHPEKAIDVAILAEGYTTAEMDSFYHHAAVAVESILKHEPFKSRADDFNFVAVASPSIDSGVSVPRLGDWKKTAFSSHFSTFYSDRYLTTGNLQDVHDALAGIPYEHIIILANTPEYGGGGIYNSYTLTTARHRDFRPVVVHEFGHSFGGLADEYFYENDIMDESYPLDIEPWEPNITTLVDFPSKWRSIVPEGTPVPTDPKNADKYPVGVCEGRRLRVQGRLPSGRPMPHAQQHLAGILPRLPTRVKPAHRLLCEINLKVNTTAATVATNTAIHLMLRDASALPSTTTVDTTLSARATRVVSCTALVLYMSL